MIVKSLFSLSFASLSPFLLSEVRLSLSLPKQKRQQESRAHDQKHMACILTSTPSIDMTRSPRCSGDREAVGPRLAMTTAFRCGLGSRINPVDVPPGSSTRIRRGAGISSVDDDMVMDGTQHKGCPQPKKVVGKISGDRDR